jgi:SAM-dependent methyltransferase
MADIASISSDLSLRDDGIWYGPGENAVSYPSDGHSACLAVEEKSFWFNHRNACIAAAVERYAPPDGGTIFDVGGGNGYVSVGLAEAGFDVVLIEPGPDGATNAKGRGVDTVVCSTAESAGFEPGSLPAIGLFDVIEHIEDDVAFLSSMHELLATGGRLYATVPAYQQLWSQEDIAAGHYRRYNVDQISAVLGNAGFEVEFASHIFRPLPLPVLLFRTVPFRLGRGKGDSAKRSDNARNHAIGRGMLAKLTRRTLQPELANIRVGKSMGFGGSILLVARPLLRRA